MRQAPCKWNRKFTTFLKQQHLVQLRSDQCMFKSHDGELYLAIHVDDGIIIGKDILKIKQLQQKLRKEFETTITEEPRSYLGIEIKKITTGIVIFQNNYLKNWLNKFNMNDAKPVNTPISQDIYMEEKTTIKEDDNKKHHLDYR